MFLYRDLSFLLFLLTVVSFIAPAGKLAVPMSNLDKSRYSGCG